jgi:hypothetical protein
VPCLPRQSILADEVEALTWAHVRSILERPEVIRAAIEQRQAEESPYASPLRALDAEIARLERRRRSLRQTIAAMEDPEDAAALEATLNQLTRAQREHEAEVARLRGQEGDWEAVRARLLELEAWCERVRGNLDAHDTPELRSLAYEALGLRVLVTRGGVAKQGKRPRLRPVERISFEVNIELPSVNEHVRASQTPSSPGRTCSRSRPGG